MEKIEYFVFYEGGENIKAYYEEVIELLYRNKTENKKITSIFYYTKLNFRRINELFALMEAMEEARFDEILPLQSN